MGIFNKLAEWLSKLAEGILKILPTSPFTDYIEVLADLPYLGYLNWFVPIGDMVAIGTAWLVAVGLFYFYSIVLRWVKAIE